MWFCLGVNKDGDPKSWTEITRIKYRRDGLRYTSDTTDEEWVLIEPHMPAKFRVGRPRETKMRAVLDAIFYIIETGCQWRMLPKDFPPFTDRTGLFLPVAGRWTVVERRQLAAVRQESGSGIRGSNRLQDKALERGPPNQIKTYPSGSGTAHIW